MIATSEGEWNETLVDCRARHVACCCKPPSLTPESLQGVVMNATVNCRGSFAINTGSGRITQTARLG